MKKYLAHFVFCLISFTNIYGQDIPDSFRDFEKSIQVKFDSANHATNDSAKLTILSNIQAEFISLLKNPLSFNYPFDSLKSIGKIKSPDNYFRLFSWNVFLTNDSIKNFSFIQIKPEKDSPCQIIEFFDNTEIDEAANKRLTPNQWYGALFYKIIPVKIENKTYYTLLGLDSYSPFISKKIIDVLSFENGKAYLGAPIFSVSGKPRNRMIFSYSARVSMMLNYDESLKTIVFDHLSPSETRYTGQFEYYGPDFSFDGFVFTKKQWLFVEDVKPNKPSRKK